MFVMFDGKEYCGHVCHVLQGKEYCGHVCDV